MMINPDDPRPFEKLLLLSGAPGVGKTTLASIIATHAGYNTIEVNASDDRSVTVLQQKINNAMEMSCIWSDGRPNCIILDEIDGAISGGEKTGITVLIEMAKSRYSQREKEKSKSSKYHPITRPIICICNDPYAPALRPLRQYAKILMIQPPCPQRILSRLKSICKIEQLDVNAGALSSLIEKGNRDIRFCLNALQIAGMKSSTLSATELELTLSSKDQSATVFDIWDRTFFHKPKKRRQEQSYSSSRSFGEFHRIIFSVNSHDLMLLGLHENMIPMIQSDPALYKVSHLLDCLEFADECHAQFLRTQNYHLANYLPTVAASFHNVCATSMRKRVEYPRQHSHMKYQHDQNDMILDTFINGAQCFPCLRIRPATLLMDIMPYLLQILCPVPVLESFQSNMLVKLEDVDARKSLIELLANFGITFKTQFRHDIGMIELAMEPSIELLCSYTEYMPPILPVEIRRFIVKEIENEHARRAERLREAKVRAEAERQEQDMQQQQMDNMDIEEETKENFSGIQSFFPESRSIMQRDNAAATVISEGMDDKGEEDGETKEDKENISLPESGSFTKPAGAATDGPKLGTLVISKKKISAQSPKPNRPFDMYDDEEAMKKRNPFAFAHKQAQAVRKQKNHRRNQANDTNKFTVRYKFKQGYTCGIKRNALLKDFL